MHLTFHGSPPRDLAQLKALVRAKGDAPATVDADKRVSCLIEVDGVHGAGFGAFAATNAEILFHYYASVLALAVGACGAGFSAGSRVASHARPGHKTGGEPS